MTVLTNIPNGASNRDIRDTINAMLIDLAALKAAGTPTPTPAPAFASQPSISPGNGVAGSTTFAATAGTVTNGAIVSRSWLLNGTAISTSLTCTPQQSGTLTYQEIASGPGGTTSSSVQAAGVAAATSTPTPAPSFTAQPSISPSSGTAGATTFTATPGTVSNGSITSRAWAINGTVISTGTTASPASSGTLTYQETATGSGGTTQSTVLQVAVGSAAAAAPTFTAQPTVSPSTGGAGATFTATPGTVSNGSITSRAWSLNGSVISTGLTATPTAGGTLTYQETAAGSGGTALSSVVSRTVTAAGASTAPIVMAFMGSSSPAEYLNNYTGGTPNDNVLASDGGTNYGRLEKGRMGMEAGTAIYAATGRQVHYMRCGASGTTLAGWESDTSGVLTGVINSIKNAIATGRVMTAVLLQVGYNDVDYGQINSSSTAAQAALLRSVISKVRAGTGLPNLTFFIGTTQDEPDNQNALRWQREAEMQVANNDANVRLGFSTYDLPTRDNTHQTEPSQIITAARFAAQVIALVNGTPQKRAAYLSAAVAVSDTQTDITVKHVDGTDFTPTTGITGFRMFDSAGAALAISAAARQSATSVRLTHASRGSGATIIYNPTALAADDATVLHDNSALALPIDVTSSALAVGSGSSTADTTAPVISTASAFSQPENAAFSVTLAANESVTWSKVGGADAAKFTLAGAVLTLPAQDYETPTDADANRSYVVTVRATDAAGNATDKTITVTITDVAEGSTLKMAQFDPGESASPATPADWNRWTYAAGTGLVATPFKTPAGVDTGWTGSTVVNGDGGATNTGVTTGSNSGVYPDNVMQSYYFNQNQASSTLKISGLDNSKLYDLELFGSRTATERYTDFTVNGVTKQLDAGNNSTQVVTFTGIAPTNGEIAFSFKNGRGSNGTLSGFGYFSGGRIIEKA
ncbi:sialate O-acetylesterase [Sphingomonas sp. CD22]|uniref:sialate O-acetylesterase n=1 Tax=Sphingomonas sp. CD22 TaxID=3100214 RepID=UPI002AE0ADB0|nr:sialate O-acetylesterase [Sphingomonas sp. CD22]MEA1083200.1 sialate O-acetylesterase [Sphingomonas sp. CD22]